MDDYKHRAISNDWGGCPQKLAAEEAIQSATHNSLTAELAKENTELTGSEAFACALSHGVMQRPQIEKIRPAAIKSKQTWQTGDERSPWAQPHRRLSSQIDYHKTYQKLQKS